VCQKRRLYLVWVTNEKFKLSRGRLPDPTRSTTDARPGERTKRREDRGAGQVDGRCRTRVSPGSPRWLPSSRRRPRRRAGARWRGRRYRRTPPPPPPPPLPSGHQPPQASTVPSRLPCGSAGDSSVRSPGYGQGVSAQPPGQAAAAAVGRKAVAPTGASRHPPWLSRHKYPSTIPPSRPAGWFPATGISCWQRKA